MVRNGVAAPEAPGPNSTMRSGAICATYKSPDASYAMPTVAVVPTEASIARSGGVVPFALGLKMSIVPD